ncbi:unnamed protein product [Vitrella brassicaformis CCMP3155]|uniref:AP2/ERF domain-containing protein n=2 Tax=Vitrella brassicaformis TaxID=1169539 RepID=A0A0G4EWV8_VITBC|nr:unnamed protein product [Vitrella brassicaformis CCMP3155]|eukprot:CEM02754.1 unnamed protein product [Vitrella brassicaformis CCMP3155]
MNALRGRGSVGSRGDPSPFLCPLPASSLCDASPPLPLRSCQRVFARGAAKKVVQKRRHMMKILHLRQERYEPKPDGYRPLPMSLTGSGPVRRLLVANTKESFALTDKIDWERYKCDVRGVRWHPNGAWRVQFARRNHEHNFFVKCDCYFRVGLYGFEGAKKLAIAYRKRLEAEWEEQMDQWGVIDQRNAERRNAARQRKEQMVEYEDQLGEGALVPLPEEESPFLADDEYDALTKQPAPKVEMVDPESFVRDEAPPFLPKYADTVQEDLDRYGAMEHERKLPERPYLPQEEEEQRRQLQEQQQIEEQKRLTSGDASHDETPTSEGAPGPPEDQERPETDDDDESGEGAEGDVGGGAEESGRGAGLGGAGQMDDQGSKPDR